jgi:hypothetical protein
MTATANTTGLNEAALLTVIIEKLHTLGTIGEDLANRTPEHNANWILGTLNQLPSLLNDLNTLQQAAQILAKESRY